MSQPTNYNKFRNGAEEEVIEDELVPVDAYEFRIKYASAKENWKFFFYQSGKYVPPQSTWKMNYGKAILLGEKL